MKNKIRVLFVCMGNICRSPTAHGVFRHMVDQAGLAHVVEVDSSGTIGFHAGEPPDRRAQQAAKQRGIDMSDLRARQVTVSDFEQFDYVLAMDRENLDNLQSLCPAKNQEKIRLFMSFAPQSPQQEVPDPYYSGGFDTVFDLVQSASQGLLQEIQSRL